jgi:hypothetical protein
MASKDKTPDNRIKTFYFFIGRTNPPHLGHIDVLIQTIQRSRESPHKYPALFLLGDGPGGIRTRDNPVEHELKKRFIVEKLMLKGFNENDDFVIEKMKQPPNLQVEEFIKRFIKRFISEDDTHTHVTIYQVAGGKDNDGAKHSKIRDDICKNLRKSYKNITFDCNVVISDVSTSGQDNGAGQDETMSATMVRKKAVELFNKHHKDEDLKHWIDTTTETDTAFQEWIETFKFYESPIQLSFELYKQIILYKDTPPYKPNKSVRSQLGRTHPYQRKVNSPSKRVLTGVGGKRYSRRGYYRNRKKYITRKRR